MKKLLINIGIVVALAGCQVESNDKEIEALKQQIEDLKAQIEESSVKEESKLESQSENIDGESDRSKYEVTNQAVCETKLDMEREYLLNGCTDFIIEDSELVSGVIVNMDAFMFEIDRLEDHYILAEDEYSFNSIGSDYLAFNRYWIEFLRIVYNEAGDYYEAYQVFNNGTQDIYLGKLIEKSVFENEEVLTDFGGEL